MLLGVYRTLLHAGAVGTAWTLGTDGLPRSVNDGVPARREWLAALLAHRLVMRGGELGRVDAREFTTARGLTWRNVEWREAGKEGAAAAVVHLCDVKDAEGKKRRYPLPVAAMPGGEAPAGGAGGGRRRNGSRKCARPSGGASDALCAVSLLRRAWEEDVALLGYEAARDSPIFRKAARGGAGTAYNTSHVARIAKKVAEAAGERASNFGAHSFRIGGASDYRDLKGPSEGRRLLDVFGRWRSDICYLYTRQSMEGAMEATVDVMAVQTRDIESIFAAFTQG